MKTSKKTDIYNIDVVTFFGSLVGQPNSLYANIMYQPELIYGGCTTDHTTPNYNLASTHVLKFQGLSRYLVLWENSHSINAFGDFVASNNLIPLSLCRKLELEDQKETLIILQLTDRSLKYLYEWLRICSSKLEILSFQLIIFNTEKDQDMPINF